MSDLHLWFIFLRTVLALRIAAARSSRLLPCAASARSTTSSPPQPHTCHRNIAKRSSIDRIAHSSQNPRLPLSSQSQTCCHRQVVPSRKSSTNPLPCNVQRFLESSVGSGRWFPQMLNRVAENNPACLSKRSAYTLEQQQQPTRAITGTIPWCSDTRNAHSSGVSACK